MMNKSFEENNNSDCISEINKNEQSMKNFELVCKYKNIEARDFIKAKKESFKKNHGFELPDSEIVALLDFDVWSFINKMQNDKIIFGNELPIDLKKLTDYQKEALISEYVNNAFNIYCSIYSGIDEKNKTFLSSTKNKFQAQKFFYIAGKDTHLMDIEQIGMSEFNDVFEKTLINHSNVNNKILELNKKKFGAEDVMPVIEDFFYPFNGDKNNNVAYKGHIHKYKNHIAAHYNVFTNFDDFRKFYNDNPVLTSILVMQNPGLMKDASMESGFIKDFVHSIDNIILNSNANEKTNVINSIKEMLFYLDFNSEIAKTILTDVNITEVVPDLFKQVFDKKIEYTKKLGFEGLEQDVLFHIKNGDSKETIELLKLDPNFLKYVTRYDIEDHPKLINVFKNICSAKSYADLSNETLEYLKQNKGLSNKFFNYLAYQKSDILVSLSNEFKSLSPNICRALANEKKYEAVEQVVKNFQEIDLDRFQNGEQVDLKIKNEINRRLKSNEIKIDSETFVNTERIRDCVNDFFNQNSGFEGNINIIKGLRDLPDNVKNLIDKIISVESDNILKLKQINYLVGVHNEKKSYSEFIKEIVYDAVENSSIDKILPVVKKFDKNNKTVAITNLMYRAIDEKEKGIDDKNNKPLKIYKALKEELKDDKECQNIFDDLSAIDPLKDVKVLSNVLHEAKNKNKDIKKDTKVFDVLKKARTQKTNNINNKNQIGG